MSSSRHSAHLSDSHETHHSHPHSSNSNNGLSTTTTTTTTHQHPHQPPLLTSSSASSAHPSQGALLPSANLLTTAAAAANAHLTSHGASSTSTSTSTSNISNAPAASAMSEHRTVARQASAPLAPNSTSFAELHHGQHHAGHASHPSTPQQSAQQQRHRSGSTSLSEHLAPSYASSSSSPATTTAAAASPSSLSTLTLTGGGGGGGGGAAGSSSSSSASSSTTVAAAAAAVVPSTPGGTPIPKPAFAGSLRCKTSNTFSAWRPRYFVLDGNELRCLAGKGDLSCSYILYLPGAELAGNPQKLQIDIRLPSKLHASRYSLRASTTSEYEAWQSALRTAKSWVPQGGPAAAGTRKSIEVFNTQSMDEAASSIGVEVGDNGGEADQTAVVVAPHSHKRRPATFEELESKQMGLSASREDFLSRLKNMVEALDVSEVPGTNLPVPDGRALTRDGTVREKKSRGDRDAAVAAAAASSAVFALRSSVHRLQSSAMEMLSLYADYNLLVETNALYWKGAYDKEQVKLNGLEKSLANLARQHAALERQTSRVCSSGLPLDDIPSDEEEDEFEELDGNNDDAELPQGVVDSDSDSGSDDEFFDAVESATSRSSAAMGTAPGTPTTQGSSSIPTKASRGNTISLFPSGSHLASGTPTAGSPTVAAAAAAAAPITAASAHNTALVRPAAAHVPSMNTANGSADFATTAPHHSHKADGNQLAIRAHTGGTGLRPWRHSLPAFKSEKKLNIWKLIKDAIGKDFSKISMPVILNEPLSALQRFAEDIEYSYLLDMAASKPTSLERLLYVAAFSISSYASTLNRTGKPFNPLLGETYEFYDANSQVMLHAEQVSHHPPVSAFHASGTGWTWWKEVAYSSKFTGKDMEVTPVGFSHAAFPAHPADHYTWRKMTTSVHNLIVGKLWIENFGEDTMVNHGTGDKCTIKLEKYRYFGKSEIGRVTARVLDASGREHFRIQGNYDESIQFVKVDADGANLTWEQLTARSAPTTLYTRYPHPDYYDQFYNFTNFAITLNDVDEHLASRVCPTDSRLRPDQRLLENGDMDGAQAEKTRLEEKQRSVRRQREAKSTHHVARWFESKFDPHVKLDTWTYLGGYTEARDAGRWENVPDLY
ncbi:oxysterol-binding protein 1 [Capsaspora owczarzaki ATCC 30864]|uniref:Oxysterol-binding protein 1 n=1 Tax=Capsaspora owczarzaki (strain ATCC 30864) TaxID=595528 RepID=A0A0D2WWW3_CAPO3|nr:oxysterol-binding protein 1 [Capsaspora owczarzaki ATCC 30864]KJE97550.1 oxysterol-binding protein 1 [Capsaspora owczarzaki ATCC 30864]|eukprot:XP_004343249.2 oxysterol-binding protein 1 [Capsaspora owczarzaki ATCC 30864]